MVKIESDIKTINKSDVSLFNFLSDFNNFEKLMPDKVINWQSTAEKCTFTIKGLATINMEINKKIPYKLINIREAGKAPFQFDMIIKLEKIIDAQTNVKITMTALINPMMTMMVSKPLKNFLDILVNKLDEINIE